MARGLNKVMLIGNLGGDPEMKYTQGGKAVATASLATSESWKDSAGNLQEKTEWHKLVFWDKLADIVCEYCHKGSKIYVEGSIQTRKWDDSNAGETKYFTEIKCFTMLMLDSKNANGGSQPAPAASGAAKPAGYDKDDDLPF